MSSSPTRFARIDAYRSWRHRKVATAYLRGYPTWIWESALRGSDATRPVAHHIT